MSASPTDLPAMDPVLAGVYQRGYSIRRQRLVRRLAAGALSLQLLVALPFAFRQGDDAGGRNVRVVAPAGQEEPSPTTTEVPMAVDAAEAPPTTTTVAPSATPSTTALVCRNSTDPRCGPFRWDPDPGPNAPVTVEITFIPAQPRVGDEVIFTVRISDPDAPEILNGTSLCLDDPGSACVSGISIERCDRYGPWDPPPRAPGSLTRTSTHTFQQAGTFRASYLVVSGSNKCGGEFDPYSSQSSGSATVVVAPAETTTTTSAG